MKDHEIQEIVNKLRDKAIKYHGAQQLREQMASIVARKFKELRDEIVDLNTELMEMHEMMDGWADNPFDDGSREGL
jgi:uncharacterized coiled-coil DUF342 family protein